MTLQYRLSAAIVAVAAIAAPALAQSDPASRAWLAQQFASYRAGSSMAPQGAPTPLANSLATWEWLRRPVPAGSPTSVGLSRARRELRKSRTSSRWSMTSTVRARGLASHTLAVHP